MKTTCHHFRADLPPCHDDDDDGGVDDHDDDNDRVDDHDDDDNDSIDDNGLLTKSHHGGKLSVMIRVGLWRNFLWMMIRMMMTVLMTMTTKMMMTAKVMVMMKMKSCGSKTTLGGTAFQGNVIHPTKPQQNLSTRNSSS